MERYTKGTLHAKELHIKLTTKEQLYVSLSDMMALLFCDNKREVTVVKSVF